MLAFDGKIEKQREREVRGERNNVSIYFLNHSNLKPQMAYGKQDKQSQMNPTSSN